jgi:hypothetical protein
LEAQPEPLTDSIRRGFFRFAIGFSINITGFCAYFITLNTGKAKLPASGGFLLNTNRPDV